MAFEVAPFAAVLEADPAHLRSLRLGLGEWLAWAGVDGSDRDDVVFAAHEAAGSAMAARADVAVDAVFEDHGLVVVVSTDDGWQAPDDDVEGQRMRLVRQVVDDASFTTQSGRSSLRLEKALGPSGELLT